MKRILSTLVVMLFVVSIHGALTAAPIDSSSVVQTARRKRPVRPGSPGEWLRNNSIHLTSTDLVVDDSDLTPLKSWLTGVRVVGLGDGTHGTHEYYTVKKRLIAFLAREEGINIITFEGPWKEFNDINRYLLTGEGDPRELVRIESYYFWQYEEMVDLLVWARSYNQTRGAKPPIHFRGVDTLPFETRKDVLAFFQQVDLEYHPTAVARYNCVSGSPCLESAREVRQRLLNNRERYVQASSETRFAEALQGARVAEQWLETPSTPTSARNEYRDRFMAENISNVLAMYEPGARAVYWGHNEHVGKNFLDVYEDPALNVSRSTGSFLREQFGAQYYVLGSSFMTGDFVAYQRPQLLTTHTMQPPDPDSYESIFKEANVSRMIINFRVPSIPSFLIGPRHLRHGQDFIGLVANGFNVPVRLLEKFDGMIYLESTTPTVPVQ